MSINQIKTNGNQSLNHITFALRISAFKYYYWGKCSRRFSEIKVTLRKHRIDNCYNNALVKIMQTAVHCRQEIYKKIEWWVMLTNKTAIQHIANEDGEIINFILIIFRVCIVTYHHSTRGFYVYTNHNYSCVVRNGFCVFSYIFIIFCELF